MYKLKFLTLFNNLKAVADLKFFADATIFDQNFDLWIRRRNSRYRTYIKVIKLIRNCIRNNKSLQRVLTRDRQNFQRITTWLPMLTAVAKEFGEVFLAVTKGCDAEIVQYANAHERSVLAILSDDTDCLIFRGVWRLWLMKDLNVETLDTFEYDKVKLRKFLDLDEDQMVVLSTISGNDIIPWDKRHVKAVDRSMIMQTWLDRSKVIKRLPSFRSRQKALIDQLYKGIFKEYPPSIKAQIEKSFEQYNTVSCEKKNY